MLSLLMHLMGINRDVRVTHLVWSAMETLSTGSTLLTKPEQPAAN